MKQIKYNRTFPSFFDDFFTDLTFFDEQLPNKCCVAPRGDVIETDEAFNVELMMPGFKKEEIEMKVEENSLIISAERKKLEETKYNTIESYFGTFKKSYTLPDYVDVSAINASYEDGVLKITVPKDDEKVGSKIIEIN
jgi:HSP20 family protein